MSETLKAWERIKKGIDTNIWECGYWDDIDLIEKSLKRLDELDNGAYVSIHINRYNELCDKEETLKIIVEKQVNVSALLTLDNLQQYNDYCDVVGGCKRLTEEEYNSLKEMLL